MSRIFYTRDFIPTIGVGPNYTEFNLSGQFSLKGQATFFRDEKTDALNLQTIGAADIVINSLSSTLEFKGTVPTTQFAATNMQLNHDRVVGGTIYPHIHWIQTTKDSPHFVLQYRRISLGQPITNTWTMVALSSDAFPYTPGTMMSQLSYVPGGISTIGGSNVSDVMQFRVIRDRENVFSTMPWRTAEQVQIKTSSIHVLAFDAHVEVDSLGSNNEYMK